MGHVKSHRNSAVITRSLTIIHATTSHIFGTDTSEHCLLFLTNARVDGIMLTSRSFPISVSIHWIRERNAFDDVDVDDTTAIALFRVSSAASQFALVATGEPRTPSCVDGHSFPSSWRRHNLSSETAIAVPAA